MTIENFFRQNTDFIFSVLKTIGLDEKGLI